MHNYFCGWYYRCQSDTQTLAIIPSVHKTKEGDFCAIQLITDTVAFHVPFPYRDFRKDGSQIEIGLNRFGDEGIHLNIHTPDLLAIGDLRFGSFSPLRYDIMGPFRYVPFMQCRHSVFSMKHTVNGEISVNGMPYVFRDGTGYMEGDRGHSFPKEYLWTQCSFPEGSLMLSVADIPFGTFRFTGIVGIVYLHGKEYRIATYLGAKPVSITPDEIIVRQRRYTLIIKPEVSYGHPLQAPVGGAMHRTIYEHPACKVYYRFERNRKTLLELDAPNAAFEYEY